MPWGRFVDSIQIDFLDSFARKMYEWGVLFLGSIGMKVCLLLPLLLWRRFAAKLFFYLLYVMFEEIFRIRIVSCCKETSTKINSVPVYSMNTDGLHPNLWFPQDQDRAWYRALSCVRFEPLDGKLGLTGANRVSTLLNILIESGVLLLSAMPERRNLSDLIQNSLMWCVERPNLDNSKPHYRKCIGLSKSAVRCSIVSAYAAAEQNTYKLDNLQMATSWCKICVY